MIQVREIANCFADRPLFLSEEGEVSYSSFADRVENLSRSMDGFQGQLAVPLEWTSGSLARFLAALQSGGNVFMGNSFPKGNLEPFMAEAPLLILQSGGSTGKPVHVVHSAETFTGKYVLKDCPPCRQLVLYSANHLAGLDAFLRAFHNGGTLVVPPDKTAQSIFDAIETYKVEILPATPTMMQFMLLGGEFEERDLSSVKVIPHGAEPMPDMLRNRLQTVFPNARLRQRFGMTELGVLPVTEDPDDPRALYLDAPNHSWKIQDGELHVWSPGKMLGTLEGGPLDSVNPWFATGDLAERTPRGSMRILGRREMTINVGGIKVIPEVVENLLLKHPDILDACVSAIPNPMTGQAVAARIVCRGSPELLDILSWLRSVARENEIGLAHVPTRIEIVPRLEMTDAGKRRRIQKA